MRSREKKEDNVQPDCAITDQVLTALRQITQAIDIHSRALEKNYAITVPQLVVLRIIQRQEPISIGRVASKTSLSISTLTGIIARLEKKGLVSRSRCEEDKRRFLLRLTNEGERFLLSAPPPLQETFLARFGELENWEKHMVLGSLQRLVAMMQAGDIDASPLLASGALAQCNG